MAKVKPTVLLHHIAEDFGTAWINRTKHNRPLDVNFRRGSTILSKKNKPYSSSKTDQKRFFEARFSQLECMYNNLTPWQKHQLINFHNSHKVGKSPKSTFFKLGSRFRLYEFLEFIEFEPEIIIDCDQDANLVKVLITLDTTIQEQLEHTAQEGEWERVVRSRP